MSELDRILLGDCLELLADKALFTDNSVDCCITSPPYFQQRDYNGMGIGKEKHSEAYLAALSSVFGHCLRIVKPTGTIVFNLGDKYRDGGLMLLPYRIAIALLDTFPEARLINDVTWMKRNPTPRQDPTKLNPSTEPFFVFAKGKHYYFDRRAFAKVEDEEQQPEAGDRVGQGYHATIDAADQLTAEEKRRAHADLDATIQAIKDGDIKGLRMKIRGVHTLAYGGQEGGRNRQIINNGYSIIRLHNEPLKRDVIETCVETVKRQKHPAVFPVRLVEEFIKLLTPRNGIILDPFSGSGTTALGAQRLQRHYIGIEIDREYHAHSVKRLNYPIQFISSQVSMIDCYAGSAATVAM